MVFHILDCALVNEWLSTCQEYLNIVVKPFNRMSFKQMWKCDQSNLEDWYTTWSAVHVWWAIIVNVAAFIIIMICYDDDHRLGRGISNLVVGIVAAYIWSQLGWFSVVKKNGCCCCFIICMSQAPILLLFFGLWLVLWGIIVILNALEWLGTYNLAWLYVVVYACYSIPLIYMGVAMLKMWNRKRSEPQLGDTRTTVIGNARM